MNNESKLPRLNAPLAAANVEGTVAFLASKSNTINDRLVTLKSK